MILESFEFVYNILRYVAIQVLIHRDWLSTEALNWTFLRFLVDDTNTVGGFE